MILYNIIYCRRRAVGASSIKYLFSVLLLLILNSCTRNNGDIGPWFGTWHLESITVDGSPEVNYENNIFWAFQSEVIFLTRVPVGKPGVHTVEKRFGTWRETEGILYLKFAYTDDKDTDGYQYHAFDELHFPYGSETPLSILKAPGKIAILQYVAPDGHNYTYKIKKQG